MRILSVDTCLRAGGVASLNRGAVVASVFSRSEEPYSSRLFNDLAALEAKTGISPADYDLFAVANGPGSFTGVRVGLTAVKAWAELYGKPIVAVSTLQAVAYQTPALQSPPAEPTSIRSQSAQARGLVCAVIDARRGQAFGGIYRIRATRLSAPGHPRNAAALHTDAPEEAAPGNAALQTLIEGVSSVPELLAEAATLMRAGSAGVTGSNSASERSKKDDTLENSEQIEFITPSSEIIRSAVEMSSFRNARITEASDDLAPWIGRAGYDKYLAGETTDVLDLDANYIRRCDAEAYWKGA